MLPVWGWYMTADRRGGNTIIGLDLIRFCAAFLVVWFHLAFWAKHAGSDAGPPLTSLPDLSASASMGWVGVEIFFVLSGIVISYSAEKASAWTFLRSRVLRIFPAIWICAPITFFILVLFGSFQFVTLTRMLVASAAVWPTGGWLDIVYWTLPIEINFYVFVFVLLCFRAFDRIDLLFAVLAIISAAAWGVISSRYGAVLLRFIMRLTRHCTGGLSISSLCGMAHSLRWAVLSG